MDSLSLVKPDVVIDVVPAAPAVARSDEFAVELLRKKLRAERGARRALLVEAEEGSLSGNL